MPTAPELLTRHWRSLSLTIAPPLAVGLLLQTLLNMVIGGQHSVVLHGELIGPSGVLDGVGLLPWAAAWLVAAPAGMLVAAGAVRGIPVAPTAALRYAMRRLVTTIVATILVIVAGYLLFVLLGVAVGVLGPIGFAGLLIIAVLLGRLSLMFPAATLEGPDYLSRALGVSHGRLFDSAWALVLGFGLLPATASWSLGWLRSLADGPVLAAPIALITLAVITGIVALQAVTLTITYLRPRDSTDSRQAADLETVDALLTHLGTHAMEPRVLAAGGLAAALAALLVAAINPFAAPVLAEAELSLPPVALLGVGVTPDGRPVLIGNDNIAACEDPSCDSVDYSRDRLPRSDVINASATVLPDGSIIGLSHYAPGEIVVHRCIHPTSCDASTIRLPKPGEQWLGAAIAVTPHDGLIIAAIVEGAPVNDVVLWRCADQACTAPVRTVLDSYSGNLIGSWTGESGRVSAGLPHMAMGLDQQGRPVIAWATPGGQDVRIARCDDELCTAIEPYSNRNAFPPNASSNGGREIGGIGIDPTGKLVVALLDRKPQRGSGLHLSIGAYDRIVLVRCDADDCQRRSELRPWHRLDHYQGEWIWIAFGGDGAPVLVHGDDPGHARVITCTANCARGWS